MHTRVRMNPAVTELLVTQWNPVVELVVTWLGHGGNYQISALGLHQYIW